VRARPIITANCDNVAKKQPVDLEDPRIEERGSEKLICLPPLPKKQKKSRETGGARMRTHAPPLGDPASSRLRDGRPFTFAFIH